MKRVWLEVGRLAADSTFVSPKRETVTVELDCPGIRRIVQGGHLRTFASGLLTAKTWAGLPEWTREILAEHDMRDGWTSWRVGHVHTPGASKLANAFTYLLCDADGAHEPGFGLYDCGPALSWCAEQQEWVRA